ncbi:MAG: magnesium-protoporphyrin IX monomethyl ester (oxidative) cyclase, partial [Pseudomonadota bacterium]
FEKWCNDEFRHGEAFALIMRSDPRLISGHNVYWIKFFTLAVFATMYVRDHARPAFHEALGLEPSDYGFKVFRITSEITRQVFPLELDIDHPKFLAGLERLRRLSEGMREAKKTGGLRGRAKFGLLALQAATTFVRIYALPTKKNTLPDSPRLSPAW